MNRHGHRRDLGFVSHLRQKKGDKSRPYHTKTLCNLRFFLFDFVRNQRPNGHANMKMQSIYAYEKSILVKNFAPKP